MRDDISREWRILHNEELCGSHTMSSDGGDKKHRIVVGRHLTVLGRRLEGSIENYLRETGGELLLIALNLWDYSQCLFS
jgi:hypothetical protein